MDNYWWLMKSQSKMKPGFCGKIINSCESKTNEQFFSCLILKKILFHEPQSIYNDIKLRNDPSIPILSLYLAISVRLMPWINSVS